MIISQLVLLAYITGVNVYDFGSSTPYILIILLISVLFRNNCISVRFITRYISFPAMPSLVSLAEELLAQAKDIERTLEKNNIPPTSFDKDTLEQLPSDAQKLRWDLLDTSHEIRQLARGARLSGLDIAFSVRVQHSL